jgi:uroporphyrinogen decarboxylase
MSDDLGFNSGPFLPPDDLREFIFPVFAEIGRMCRSRDLPLILHSCGNLNAILPDLIACGANCFHSLPPNLYDLADLKKNFGHQLSFSGNIDLTLLATGSPAQVRNAVQHVRHIWASKPTGGILLSSSNSIAHYAKIENYQAMMDELHHGSARVLTVTAGG